MQHLSKIDHLRALAIVLVFAYHSLLVVLGDFEINQYHGWFFDFEHVSTKQLLLNLNPLALGHVGVELFLIISGFLIHWIYLKGGSTFKPAKFYTKRFWRIYPPYLVALAVFVAWLGTGGWFNLLTHLTLTHNLFAATFYGINPSFWSLALEAQLYLLYPVFLLLRKRLGLKRAVGAVALVSMVSLGVSESSALAYSSAMASLWIVWVLGAYLGEQFHRQHRLYTAHPVYLVLGYVGWVALKMTVVSAYFGNVLFSVLAVYAIDYYLHRPASVGWLARKVSRAAALVGTYSYGLYLFHQPLLRPLIKAGSLHSLNKVALTGGLVLTFGVCLALAALSYRLLEVPAIGLGGRFYQRFLTKPAPQLGRHK